MLLFFYSPVVLILFFSFSYFSLSLISLQPPIVNKENSSLFFLLFSFPCSLSSYSFSLFLFPPFLSTFFFSLSTSFSSSSLSTSFPLLFLLLLLFLFLFLALLFLFFFWLLFCFSFHNSLLYHFTKIKTTIFFFF